MARVTVSVRARRSLRDRLEHLIGVTVESTADAHHIVWCWPKLRKVVAVAIGAWLGLFAIAYLGALAKFPLWGPFSTTDEYLQYYQVARNYNTYGFMSSAMLPDLSTASSAAGHPYLYNHQPPGPQLFIAGLMRIFGENFGVIRVVFAMIFVAGIASFVAFAKLVDRRYAYAALGIVVLLPPRTILQAVDHPGKSVFAFFAFFPLVALYRYRETRRHGWLLCAAVVTFVASNYLMYSHLFMILAFWTFGMLLKFLPIERRHLALFFVLVAIGIALHLMQTVVVLGWPVFVREMTATVSNRMFGVPTREELAQFFLTHSLVLYGGHAFDLKRFVETIWKELSFPARNVWMAAGVIVLVAAFAFEARITRRSIEISRSFARWLKQLGVAALWTGGCVIVPIVMFPAFAIDYSLQGASEFVVALFVFLSVCVTLAYIRELPSPQAVRIMLAVVVVGFVVGVGAAHARDLSHKLIPRTIVWLKGGSPHAGLTRLAESLRGQVTMTNVDPTVVGFFTREIAYGGCHDEALAAHAIDPSACRVSFVRRFPPPADPVPTAYVWVGSMQAFCDERRACIDRASLDRHYTKIFESGLVAAYDLTKPL